MLIFAFNSFLLYLEIYFQPYWKICGDLKQQAKRKWPSKRFQEICSDLGETESHSLRVYERQTIWNIYCFVSFAQKAKYHLNIDKSELEDD